MLTDIDGVLVGHWTEPQARTGCTVVVFPEGTVASGEVRGGAPATREFAMLDPIRSVSTVDAVVLSGGSAFGLAASDGVMNELEGWGRGFETPYGRVPIVVAMALYDLGVGNPSVRPGSAEGRAALRVATDGAYDVGLVGAGTGATVDKWSGTPKPGGIGTATLRAGELSVAALIAVNSVGAIDDGTSTADIGPPRVGGFASRLGGDDAGPMTSRQHTTIGVVVTNAVVDKVGCHRLAQGGHDGLARSLLPAHTAGDGDALVVGATGVVDADPLHLRALVQAVVASAIRRLGAL